MDPKLNHLKKIFRSLLLPEKNGLTMVHFRKLYLEMEGEEIPYRRFGFNTDIELLKSMNGVVHLRLDDYGNLKVLAKQSTESQHIVDLVAQQNKNRRSKSNAFNKFRTPRFNQHIQPSIQWNGHKPNVGHRTNQNTFHFGSFHTPRALNSPKVPNSTCQQPTANSIKSADSDSLNQNMISNSSTLIENQRPISSPAKPSVGSSFVNSMDKSMNNFSHSKDQLDGSTNTNHHQNNAQTDKSLIVCDTPDNSNDASESNSETENEDGWPSCRGLEWPSWSPDEQKQQIVISDSAIIDDIVPIELFPLNDDAVEVNKIAEPKFDLFKFIIGKRLKIRIPQIFSPYKFWFHIEEEIAHLDILMGNLFWFYEQTRSDPITVAKIPKDNINVGQICAVKYFGEWHRGKVLYVGLLVKIFFIDYGTVAEVKYEDLRFLAKDFAILPAFAHRGILDMVKPTFGTWTINDLHFFDKFIKFYQYNLIDATITNINEKERTVYFKLTDENQTPIFDIAETLIRNNCAYPTKKSLADFQRRHLNEIRPSFDRLESGEYPAIKEIFDFYEEKQFDWITFDEMRLDLEYVGYETIE